MAATPLRSVRVNDALWSRASETARERGETVTDVITRALSAYVETPPPYRDVLRIIASRIETETDGRLTPTVLDTAGCVVIGTASGHLAIDGLRGEVRADAFDVGVYDDVDSEPLRIVECHSIDDVVRFVRAETKS